MISDGVGTNGGGEGGRKMNAQNAPQLLSVTCFVGREKAYLSWSLKALLRPMDAL